MILIWTIIANYLIKLKLDISIIQNVDPSIHTFNQSSSYQSINESAYLQIAYILIYISQFVPISGVYGRDWIYW
jgi:hypothetical protein